MKTAFNISPSPQRSMQLFEADPQAIYPIDVAARLARVPRRLIAVYYKYGLVASVADPEPGGLYFGDDSIRALRRIEYLRTTCGLNVAGIKLLLDLIREVEHLREEVRFLQRR